MIAKLVAACCISALVGLSGPAAAQGSVGATVQASRGDDRDLYESWVQGVFQRDILGRLPISMRASLGPVSLIVPDTRPGDAGQFPLAVSSDPGRRTVVFPLATIRWLDQYSAVTALVARSTCDNIRLLPLAYVGKLALSWSRTAPTPFGAFGLDAHVYDDPFVRQVSSRQLSSAIGFLMTHELGHIALQHAGGLRGAESQRQEREADAYALSVMRALRLNPLGMPMLFVAAALLENGQTTHPMSGERMNAAAEVIEAHPADFVDREEPDARAAKMRIIKIAQEIRGAMPLADDPVRRQAVLDFGQRFTFGAFHGALSESCPKDKAG